MAQKKYLDLTGLGQFKNKLLNALASNSSSVYPVHYAETADTATSATTATTAGKWTTARTVTFDGTNGDVSGSFSIDGSANVSNVALTVDGLSDKVDKNGTDRLMTAAEGTKLSGIDANAQENVIENVSIDGTNQTITSKTVALDLSAYAKKSEIVSAMSFKGGRTGTQLAALTVNDVINGDIYTCTQDGAKDEGTASEFNFYVGYEYAAVVTPEVPAHGEPEDPDYEPAVPASLGWVELGKYLDLASYVQTSRTVNSKALSSDITLDGSDIDLSSNYAKASSASAITTSDSIDTAIGKLEKKADDNASAISTLQGNATTYTFAEGSTNGAFQVTPTVGGSSGTTQTVSIHGLGSAAYGDTTDFVSSSLAPAEAGAQVNVIEHVTVNGTTITPDATKTVEIPVPTAASSIANGETGYATGGQVYTYVQNNKGDVNVINTVKVNGTALTPDVDKAVNVSVPVTDVQTSTDGSTYTSRLSGTVAQIDLSPYTVDADLVAITETEINGLFPSASPGE